MRQLLTFIAVAVITFCAGGAYAQSLAGRGVARELNYWHPIPLAQAPASSQMPFRPGAYLTFTLDETSLKSQMFHLSTDPANGAIISLPMPDGNFRKFKVWQTPMMPSELSAKYPEIRTFTGEAVGDVRITAKLDFTSFGFHAMIFEPGNTSFIDPYDNHHDGYYFAHYKRDEFRGYSSRMKCELHTPNEAPTNSMSEFLHGELPSLDHTPRRNAQRTTNGWTARTYTLALSADHFYCQAATGLTTPTIAQCLSAMTTSMNRINGVYNREFSVQMNFCAKEDTLIWPTATGSINGTDPFNAIDANPNACLTTNQTTCDTRIGSANYGLGHVFTTGGGGLSALGVVCTNGQKAQSVTGSPTPVGDGYDIDYVAHEMGHEFGSNHTFNNNTDGSCGGNAVSSVAYEPASGATIMDYAGICNPDDIQMHSDPYFSASSLIQIVTRLKASEESCALHTSTGNHVDTLPHFTASYSIPYKTPFELIGPTAIDSGSADTATTYQWLQWNLGDFGKRLNQTFVKGPIFRSYNPVYTTTRIFPRLSMVLSGVLSNAGTEGAEGEKAPDTARYLTFRLVSRDIMAGYGCFHLPDDTVHLDAVQTPTKAGFVVTSQGTTGIVYLGGTTQTVTWNVVGTNAAPVNAANVDIYMSTDGGNTWPYTIGTFPNTGTASVVIPNPATSTSTARIKVKGSGNVFFNINKNNFTVNPNTTVGVTGPINGTLSICAGATTTLTDTSAGGTWVSSNTGVATIGVTSGIVTGVAAGTSIISYTAAAGTVTAVVTINALPVVSAILGGSTVCIGQTTSLSDATAGGTWTSSNTAVATVGSSGIVTGVAAGTVNISYSVTNTCGTTVVLYAVTVSTGITVAPISGTLSACAGGTSTLTDATAAGAWVSSNPAVATIGATGIVSALTAGTTTISYNVTSGSGCTSNNFATFTVNPLPTASISPSGTITICASGSALFTATAGAGYSYQWQSGAVNIPGETNATYTATAAGNYQVVVTGTGGCASTSAAVTVIVGTGFTVVPSVSISGDLGTTLCTAATLETFTAMPVNGGSAPTYQWYVNGAPVATTATYSYVPAAGDLVSVLLTSNSSCASPDTASSTVAITIAAPVTPSVSITSIHGDSTCTGDTVQFAAVPVYGGTAPTYLWTENGINVATGPYYIYTPHDGDTLILTMTSNYPCVSTPVAVSSIFIVHVFAPAVNTLNVIVSQSSISSGSVDTFTAVTTGAGSAPTFQWYLDGSPIAGATNSQYITDSLRNGQVVSCLETSSFVCSSPGSIMSGGISVSVTSGVQSVAANTSKFTLLPNPNNGDFTINGSQVGADENVNIVVTDLLGQTVYTKAVSAKGGNVNEHISLGRTLARGTYLVSVTSGNTHTVFHIVIDK